MSIHMYGLFKDKKRGNLRFPTQGSALGKFI
jgi:hypothetical protein